MGRFRDLIHRGTVVAVGNEDLLGCIQQLGTAFIAGQPG
jgi:hypothetical protein